VEQKHLHNYMYESVVLLWRITIEKNVMFRMWQKC